MRTQRPDAPAGYGEMIRALNTVHYAGETGFYASAPLRRCERVLRDRLPTGAQVLDVGCGAGRVVARIAGTARGVGMDVNLAALRAARTRLADQALVGGSMAALPFASGRFEAVWCLRFSFNALPTAAERLGTLTELWRVCAPGGTVLVEAFNWHFTGRLGLIRLANLFEHAARHLRWHGQGQQGSVPLPSRDIIYLANKTETAAPGYAHLTTVGELQGLVDQAGLAAHARVTDEAGVVAGDHRPVRRRHRDYSFWLVLDKPSMAVSSDGGRR